MFTPTEVADVRLDVVVADEGPAVPFATICARAPPNTTELCGLAFKEPLGPPGVAAPLSVVAPPG